MSAGTSHFRSAPVVRYHDVEPDIFVKRNALHPSLLVGED